MLRFLLRRLLILPFVILVVHFFAYGYATLAVASNQAQNPFGAGRLEQPNVLQNYASYLKDVSRGDFGDMPGLPTGANPDLLLNIARAAGASLGLLCLAFLIAGVLGVTLGLAAVRTDPPGVRSWMVVVSTLGLATPGFYIGTLLIAGVVAYMLRSQVTVSPIPVSGYGWDIHLLLPLFALTIRPTMQVAQVTANLLADELNKQYVVAARGFGHTWQAIRREKAFRNVLAPLIITLASALRMLVAELILVEWLFNWPGLGLLLTQVLVPPKVAMAGSFFTDVGARFLDPALMAGVMLVFGLLFYLTDTISTALARQANPRLAQSSGEEVLVD